MTAMTQPPHGPPPSAWQPPPVPPRRPRPRLVWFVVAGVLIVLAPIVFATALFTVLRPMTQEDAVFRADGAVQVELPPDEERALFTHNSSFADCAVTDDETGEEVPVRPVTGDFTYNEWTAVARFGTGSGRLTFTCTGESPSAEIRIAQLPSTGAFVGGIVVGVVGPILLFLVGVIMLIVVGIRWATGEPRPARS